MDGKKKMQYEEKDPKANEVKSVESKGRKTIRIFIGEGDDKKRVFENIRMALGITLRGHKVILCLSEKTKKLIEGMKYNEKKEVEEFLDSIPLMGGEVYFCEFENFLKGGEEFDFFVV